MEVVWKQQAEYKNLDINCSMEGLLNFLCHTYITNTWYNNKISYIFPLTVVHWMMPLAGFNIYELRSLQVQSHNTLHPWKLVFPALEGVTHP